MLCTRSTPPCGSRTGRDEDVTTAHVPASTANLGAGFDVLGMALGLRLAVGDGEPPTRGQMLDGHHPASVAFARAGGDDRPLWIRSPIPMGRGLGFSGAARVAGAALATAIEHRRLDDDGRRSLLTIAAELEAHGDNAAASAFGGVTAWVAGQAVSLPLGSRLGSAEIVAWIPRSTTSTARSRATLDPQIDRQAATANLGAVAQFVVALADDDPDLLAGATEDHMHQRTRFAAQPAGLHALSVGIDAGAWCGWLSGSGPTVALWVDPARTEAVLAALPAGGAARRLTIDTAGVEIEG